MKNNSTVFARRARRLLCGAVLTAAPALHAQIIDHTPAAQAFRAGQPVRAVSDTMVVAEGEEFKTEKPGWLAQPWGANYYAATFANSFLSRQAFIGAPEQADDAAASITVEVPKAGRYLALIRYEAAPRFETQFHLRVEQNGQEKLNRLYGARQNLKVWAFREGLKTEVSWPWGAVENVVWEGHDAYVDLAAGTAKLTLVAGRQPTPAARRNIDLVLLTSDTADVQTRIAKDAYLPLDGLLTQEGDVFLKMHNTGTGAITLTVPPGREHSPYWIHTRTWKPKTLTAAAGAATEWTEVGSVLDSLNDGQWDLTAKGEAGMQYSLEFGVRDAAGAIAPIKRFEKLTGNLQVAYFGNTRYSRRLRSTEELLYELNDYLKKQPVFGKPLQRTLVYGSIFDKRPDNAKYTAARQEFINLMSGTGFDKDINYSELDKTNSVRGYVDVRGQNAEQLKTWAAKVKAEGKADRIAVVSLGDEIGLSAPPANDSTGFRAWLQQRGLKPGEVDAAATGWDQVNYKPDAATMEANPRLYYYSKLYGHHFGIKAIKELTDAMRPYLTNAGFGANYSPHGGTPYIGEVHSWVSTFREGGMTMPWGEDYIWQLPMGTQQMNFLNVDTFRAGIKGKPDAKILMYVMPHWPGNTTAGWRRQFYGNIAHGTKIFNLFEFRPVQAAYTENHVSLPAMFQEVRRGLYELGGFEDIVQDGQVRPAQAGLWFSETGDIWENNRTPFAAAKRTLYIAIRHQQLPLDVVVEQDALAGDLKNYKTLYLSDRNVSRAAALAIAAWVAAGGKLFATAGAGLRDEFNAPNTIMQQLLGVEPTEAAAVRTATTVPIRFEKEDLPFAEAMTTIRWTASAAKTPVFGAISPIKTTTAQVQAAFEDGAPAVAVNKVGQGTATYAAFLPGLSYFKPAIPLRPVDRGSTDDSMAHYIPTQFDAAASQLIGSVAETIQRPVVASEPLVETNVIESPKGMAIPLVNWSAGPVKELTVTINLPVPYKSITLASGGKVKVKKQGAATIVTLSLDVADTIVLR